MICRLTGTAPPHSLPTDRDMDPIDISHLWKEYPVPCMEICWMLLDITELVTHGYDRGAGDEQLFLYLDPDSIHFQSDNLRRVKQNKDPKRRRVEPPGQLDPSIDAILADVFPILEGDTGREWLALVSPTYKWQAHYINATPDSLLQRLYYDRPIADIIGGTYGDRLAIKFDVTKRLEAFSGSADAIGGPVLLGGLDSDLVLRTGMGVAFKISASAMSEAASRLSALAVLHGLIIAISDASVISVRVVLVHRNLPAFMNWRQLGAVQALQTRLVLQITPGDVIAVHRIMPHALYQHCGHLPSSRSTPGSVDLVVVGDLNFQTPLHDPDSPVGALSILCAMHGIGDFPVKMELARVSPFPAREALSVISRNYKLHGFYGPGSCAWLHHIATALYGWALDKTNATKLTTADNTLHLRIPGPVFATMLHDLVPWGPTIGMRRAVTLCDGLLMVTLPDFESAAGLLGRNNGLFDFTTHGRGFVELYAPIAFKWEMYDTGRSQDESRSPDGFVAITFAFYEQRNVHNDFVITDTREHRNSPAQLLKPPSQCSRS